MALNIPHQFARFLSVKKLTWVFALIAFICLSGSVYTYKRMQAN